MAYLGSVLIGFGIGVFIGYMKGRRKHTVRIKNVRTNLQ